MKQPRPTIGQIAARRRGVLAISLAVAMMLIIFGTLLGLTQSLAAGYLRTENAWAAAQALYAAEAGLDVALQTRSNRPVVGRCGRARYAVQGSRTQTVVEQLPSLFADSKRDQAQQQAEHGRNCSTSGSR